MIRDARLFAGGYNLSGDSNATAVEVGAKMLDATNFDSGGAEEFEPGLISTKISGAGFWNTNYNTDAALFARIGLPASAVTVAVAKAIGSAAYFIQALNASYSPGGQVGELLKYDFQAQGTGTAPVRGVVMENGSTARAATFNGTAVQAGAVATGQSLFAALHVFAAPGVTPTLSVALKSATSGAGPFTTRATFTTATAVGALWLPPVAGPFTDTWWRADATITGTGTNFLFAVSLGIRATPPN